MKLSRKVCLVLITLFVSAAIFAEDTAEGFWISIDDKTGKPTAGWEIYIEGNKLHGKILSIAGYPQDVKAIKCKQSYRGFPISGQVNQLTIVGTPWIFGLVRERPGRWINGNVIDPEKGEMYKCIITFHAAGGRYSTDTLEMRGEIGLGIGRSQFWKKASREEAAGLR
jgi:uncharacterized protein (DUF2147 family)